MRSWPARKTQFALFASVVRWIIFAWSAFCILLPASTKAQENIWVGQPNVPGFWSDLAEWNLGTVPASSIPDGSINIDISQGTVLGDVVHELPYPDHRTSRTIQHPLFDDCN